MKARINVQTPDDEPSMVRPRPPSQSLGLPGYREIVARMRRRFEYADVQPTLADLVGELAPTLAVRFSELRRSHAALLHHADALTNDEGMSERELTSRLDGVLAAIEAHDRAEADLLQDALLQDLGGNE